ncbi:hypothetical protein [Microvirga lotononidis]|nr:hypothetical protein [Microvirga lotononidis]WQO28267.1 hypothetical protein U0023_03950 [Microvirga lotononidis]
MDTLQLTGGGTFDLTHAAVCSSISSIEAVRGSDRHDTIIVDQTIFAGIATFNGGASPAAHLDEIVLRGAVFDFTGKSLVGIDRLVLETWQLNTLDEPEVDPSIEGEWDRLAFMTTRKRTRPERSSGTGTSTTLV